MKLRKDIINFLQTIKKDTILVAATKYVDSFVMEEMLNVGIKNFGENRVDSFLDKYENLKHHSEIVWHFIGHLQRNKAKYIANKIDYLHSLDSVDLAKVLSKTLNKPLKCFIEVSINNEESKNGVKIEDLPHFIKELKDIPKIKVVGLMMMSVKNSDEKSLNSQFQKLEELRDQIEKEMAIELPYLSMGMSDDYLIALKHGATHIRLGRILYEN